MGFSPLIQWQNLIYFAGDKRGEGLLYSLACSYSAPVLYKPDNKYGTRQGCPLWKELFQQKSLCWINAPQTAGSNATHRDGAVCQNM